MLSPANIQIISFSLPVYQLLYYTIQLVSFKKTNQARRYFGLLLLGMTLFLIFNAVYYLSTNLSSVWLYIFFVPILLSLPPVFYLYIISLLNEKAHISKFSRFILFIPPLVILALNMLTTGIGTPYRKQLFLASDITITGNSIQSADGLLLIFWAGAGLFVLAQLLLASWQVLSLLKAEKSAVKEQPRHLAYLQFRWVYIIAVSMLLFMLAASAQLLFVNQHDLFSAIFINLIILICTGLAGYFGMKQDELFTQVSRVGFIALASEKTGSDAAEAFAVGNKKLIPDDDADEIIRTMETLLAREKLYLNKRLTITDLSKQTGVSRNKLAYVINDVMGKNFYGLINDYRVEEAINIMKTSQNNPTIDAIADLAGFHSRSSFYACFKKYTGVTPKEFMSQDNTD